MSACINYLQFRPFEVELPESIDELKDLLALENGKPVLMSLSSVSGRACGWKVKPEVAERLASAGVQPQLITHD